MNSRLRWKFVVTVVGDARDFDLRLVSAPRRSLRPGGARFHPGEAAEARAGPEGRRSDGPAQSTPTMRSSSTRGTRLRGWRRRSRGKVSRGARSRSSALDGFGSPASPPNTTPRFGESRMTWPAASPASPAPASRTRSRSRRGVLREPAHEHGQAGRADGRTAGQRARRRRTAHRHPGRGRKTRSSCSCRVSPTWTARGASLARRRCSNGSSSNTAPPPRGRPCLSATGGVVPPNTEVAIWRSRPGEASAEPPHYLVRSVADITGRDLRNARSIPDENYQPAVAFSLTRDAARRFAQLTGDNVGRSLAIILDGRVQSAPQIEGRIDGGEGHIRGRFTQQQAADLSLVLRAGALPASMTYLGGRSRRAITRHRVDPRRRGGLAGRARLDRRASCSSTTTGPGSTPSSRSW